MPDVDMYVGGRIAARRRTAEWSVETLAERSGIPVSRLRAYEAGEQRPTADDLISLHEALGVAPSYFFEGFSPNDENTALKRDAEAWMSTWPKE